MRVLIVEPSIELGELWRRHIERMGAGVETARSQDEAIAILRERGVDVIVLDLVLDDGAAFAVADFASYRWPLAKVVFVTNTSFFSDGSIFRHIPNACAFVQARTPPEDLAAIVEHHGQERAIKPLA